jgi:hypothetical protein
LRLNQGQKSRRWATAFPLWSAEIAAKLPKRLHPWCVSADYRKAANDDGSTAPWVADCATAVQVSASGNHDKNEMTFGSRICNPGVI